MQLAGVYESLYVHTHSKKIIKVRSLKGFLLTAVAWNPESNSPDVANTFVRGRG